MVLLDELDDDYKGEVPLTPRDAIIRMYCNLHHIAGVSDRIDPILRKLRQLSVEHVSRVAIDQDWMTDDLLAAAGTDKVVDAIGLSPDDYTEFPEITSSITAGECKLSVCLGVVCNVVIKILSIFSSD